MKRFGDHDDSTFGNGEPRPVKRQVVADRFARWHHDALVDDAILQTCVLPDPDVVEQDGAAYRRSFPNPHVAGQYRMAHHAAGNHDATGQQHVVNLGRNSVGPGDAPRRRRLPFGRTDRPILLIEIQRGLAFQQVHVRFEVGVEGAHISPVSVVGNPPFGTAESVTIHFV